MWDHVDALFAKHKLRHFFDTVWCADDGPGKPHPAMLQAAMNACNACSGTTVMIGDTAHDITMALNAGVRPQGVAWGFHTVEEQQAAGARHVARSFAELTVVLDGFADLTRAA